MIPWVRLATAAAVLGGVFAWGWHLGAGHVQTRLDALISAQNEAVVRSQAEIIRKEAAYAHQLQDAASAHDRDLADLDRIRSAPVHHVLCHAAQADSGAVSGVPGTAGNPGTGSDHSGGPDPVRGADFDPSIALRALHVTGDTALEECRTALAKWPH